MAVISQSEWRSLPNVDAYECRRCGVVVSGMSTPHHTHIQTAVLPAPMPEPDMIPLAFAREREADLRRVLEHWKTVAESAAAERDALKAKLDAAAPHGFRDCRCGAMNCRADHAPVRISTAEEDLRAMMVSRERGPGIAATKPDNALAWLDEDLLCDDVEPTR